MHDQPIFDTLCNSADGVFIVDAQKRILCWNKGAEKITGFCRADVLNQPCFRVMAGEFPPGQALCGQNCKMHAHALRGIPQKNFDMMTRDKDRRPVWLNVSVLAQPDGERPFVAHILRDVTREKIKEQALEQCLEHLESHGLLKKEDHDAPPRPGTTPANKPFRKDKAVASLSKREIEVLTLLAEGLSTKNIAQRLDISHFTARNHIQNILAKLNLHSKAQAVSYAYRRGIL